MSVNEKGWRAERGRDVRGRDDIMLSAWPFLQKGGIHCACVCASVCVSE